MGFYQQNIPFWTATDKVNMTLCLLCFIVLKFCLTMCKNELENDELQNYLTWASCGFCLSQKITQATHYFEKACIFFTE